MKKLILTFLTIFFTLTSNVVWGISALAEIEKSLNMTIDEFLVSTVKGGGNTQTSSGALQSADDSNLTWDEMFDEEIDKILDSINPRLLNAQNFINDFDDFCRRGGCDFIAQQTGQFANNPYINMGYRRHIIANWWVFKGVADEGELTHIEGFREDVRSVSNDFVKFEKKKQDARNKRDMDRMVADAKKAVAKRIADAKKAEEKRKADAKKAEEKRKADAKKAEEKRKADAKKAEEVIVFELQKLKDKLEKLQDLELFTLKETADTLIIEIENNTNSNLLMLRSLRDRLLSVNATIKNEIKAEERRIAFVKKAEEVIVFELQKLKDKLEKLQDLELFTLKETADTLIIEIENNTKSDLATLIDYRDRLYSLNSLVVSSIKAEEKRLAEEKRITEEKRIAEEELNKKLSLLPSKTELQNAQDFIDDIARFVESNPNEFDIMEIAMFKINTQLISEGISNDEQINNVDIFKEFVKTSSAFKKFQKTQQEKRIQVNLNKIDQVLNKLDMSLKSIKSVSKSNISSNSASLRDKKIKSSELLINNALTLSELENLSIELTLFLNNLDQETKRNIAIKQAEKKIKGDINLAFVKINKDINKLKTYLAENLSSISPELMTLVVANVNKLEKIKKQLFNSDKAKLDALENINIETSTFLYDSNILTSSELALKIKKDEDKKKAEERKKKAEAKKIEIANAKSKKPYKEERFIKIINSAKLKFNASTTAAAKGRILYDRTQEICRLITSIQIYDWKGKVTKIQTNQDGWGVLGIEIDTDITLHTNRSAFGDWGSDTLINPGSGLFNSLMNLAVGDTINFSGSFFKEGREKGTCLNIISVRLKERVLDPEYEFKFTRIEKIN